MVPPEPTTHPVLASTKETPQRKFCVPLDWGVQPDCAKDALDPRAVIPKNRSKTPNGTLMLSPCDHEPKFASHAAARGNPHARVRHVDREVRPFPIVGVDLLSASRLR